MIIYKSGTNQNKELSFVPIDKIASGICHVYYLNDTVQL
jgi:hypothetical protein